MSDIDIDELFDIADDLGRADRRLEERIEALEDRVEELGRRIEQ